MEYSKYTIYLLKSALTGGKKRAMARKVQCDHSITVEQLLLKLELQDWRCPYCHDDISEKPSLEHLVPISKGGTHTLENIYLSCWRCNKSKHTKTQYVHEPANRFENDLYSTVDERYDDYDIEPSSVL